MAISEFTQQDYAVIARDYADLKEAARKRCANQGELDMVQKAFDFANEAHKGVRRRSGEPYILHPIAVAQIVVSNIGLGYKSICAALLHDVVEDTDYTVDDIRNIFGDKIASLVDGLTKIKTVLDNEDKAKQNSIQAENFKRILLTLNDDVRVVLIKLADRLHNCRTIEFMPEYKRDKILSETMFIFIPLAHRLGLYEVKSEMEDIWLRYKEPQAFNEISEKINRNINDKEKEIDEFIRPINEALTAAGFNFEIKKRVKTPYSIWHKMITKGITFEQVYDLYAVRIIFNPNSGSTESERDQCYHVFSIITGIYRYKSDRIRDWVKHPKNNGYEALHCTLMSHSGIWIEVQIRTTRMNDIAERGIAAHWTYKKDGFVDENENEMDSWISKVKEILVNPDVNALELLDIIHNDLTTTDIFVFTPKGDQKRIPKGATALDFAYSIHSEIGNKAIAAKVNMKLEPLSYELKTGDQVEIITAETEKPKREWLQFLKTRKAKNIVLDYLKGERQESINIGRKMVEEQLSAIGGKLNDSTVKAMLNGYEIFEDNADELYFRVGIGLLKLNNLEEIIRKSEEKQSKSWGFPWFKNKEKKNSYVINDESDTKHKYVIANCCNPIPGDSVVGFLASDGTVTVHKKSCSVANSIAAKHGDRIVMPVWEQAADRSFLVRLSLKGVDRIGIINEISRYISLVMSVNIRKFCLGTEEGIFEGYIDLYVHDKEDLEKLIKKLNKIEGITSVVRSDI
ncbi:MAG: bifunctional (p)ppGpp synthetase/guanosine-3',5'-bis(diphosphate) 3'-pyrophosphohydrolase [Bacteroidetes bacterium]|jgi:GTP pyrophosphokinase|uniref:Bifunctional (P)ppGpp synthetase/guanosine-3',5'-bis(Diphosphate) 3'-pyrophosphohydrolase n=1 Tax=Candidatus Cryptobacteroides avicola TaxID=2840757 RepID=A0A940DTE9_9BACT|nr:bifunctional (p)ppGpp synthetase/guanosine-3',5'-bis(diphosphate) 3'-pyrophosphohydrolase [Candidatus Cryptobacteroides avicola]